MSEPTLIRRDQEELEETKVTEATLHVTLDDGSKRTFLLPVQAVASHRKCQDYKKNHPQEDGGNRATACIKVNGHWVCL